MLIIKIILKLQIKFVTDLIRQCQFLNRISVSLFYLPKMESADTFWKAFKPDDPEFSPYGSPLVNSYCHAWSCTPVYLIEKYNL